MINQIIMVMLNETGMLASKGSFLMVLLGKMENQTCESMNEDDFSDLLKLSEISLKNLWDNIVFPQEYLTEDSICYLLN